MRTKWKNFLSAIIAISMIATTLSPVGFAADMNYAAEETAFEEAAAEEPALEESVSEEPVAEEPALEESVSEEPVAEEPALEESVSEGLVAGNTVATESFVDEALEEDVAYQQSFVLPVVQEGEKLPAPQGMGISLFTAVPAEENTAYTYYKEEYINIGYAYILDPDTLTRVGEKPEENGILQLLDENGDVVANSETIGYYNYNSDYDYETGTYTYEYYINGSNIFDNRDAIKEGFYTLQLVAGNTVYPCESRVAIIGEGTFVLSSFYLNEFYAGADSFSVEFQVYGIETEAELENLSFEVLDEENNVIARTTGSFANIYLDNYTERLQAYAEMKVLSGKSIEEYGNYSLKVNYGGDKILIDAAGAVSQYPHEKQCKITELLLTEPNDGMVTVLLENLTNNREYSLTISDSWGSSRTFAQKTFTADSSTMSVDLQLTLNGSVLSLATIYEFCVEIECTNPYVYDQNSFYMNNPLYDRGNNGGYEFSPFAMSVNTRSLPFVLRSYSDSFDLLKGTGYTLTLQDEEGNVYGTCEDFNLQNNEGQLELSGTISITKKLSDRTYYEIYLDKALISEIYATSALYTMRRSMMMDSGEKAFWCNFGEFPIDLSVLNSSGNGYFVFKNNNSVVLRSDKITGVETEDYGFLKYKYFFTAKQLEALSATEQYSLYYVDANGLEQRIFENYHYDSKKNTDNLLNNYFYINSAIEGDTAVQLEMEVTNRDGFRNITVDDLEVLKNLTFSSDTQTYTVAGIGETGWGEYYNYNVELLLNAPLQPDYYEIYSGSTRLGGFTVSEKENSDDIYPVLYSNTVTDGFVQGCYLPTESVYTGKVYKGFSCLSGDTPMKLSLLGENNGNTQFLTLPEKALDNLETGIYELRIFIDDKFLSSVELFIAPESKPIVKLYDETDYTRIDIDPVIYGPNIYSEVSNADEYKYIRWGETTALLEDSNFQTLYPNRRYDEELSSADGAKTFFVELSKSGKKGDSENLLYSFDLWLCSDGDYDLVVPEKHAGIMPDDSLPYTLNATLELPYANVWVAFETDNGIATEKMEYVGKTDDGRYEFALECKPGYTSIDDKYGFYYKNTREIRVFATNLDDNYNYVEDDEYNSSYRGEIKSSVVERVLSFGNLTRIILPQFKDYYEENYTTDGTFEVYGYTYPNRNVTIEVGGEVVGTGLSNAFGKFTIKVTGLTEGYNYLCVYDDAGTPAADGLVIMDSIAPVVSYVGFTFLENGAAVIRWNCADNDVSHFIVYKNNTKINEVDNTSNSYNITATPDDGNRFTIKAVDYAGNVGEKSASTADEIPPTVPTNLNVQNLKTTSLNLAWTKGEDNIGIASYEIYKDGVKIDTIYGENNCTYFVSGLNQNTEYLFAVKSVDKAGNTSDLSEAYKATTIGLQINPVSLGEELNVDLYRTYKTVPVSASVSATDTEYPVVVSSAVFEYRKVGTEEWNKNYLSSKDTSVSGLWGIAGFGSNEFIEIGEYEIRFTVTEKDGVTVSSEPEKIKLKYDDVPPTTPGAPVSISHDTSSITFSWDIATDNIELDYYEVYRDNEKVASNIKTNTYTDSGLEMNQSYSYHIVAVDIRGNQSDKSVASSMATMLLEFDSVTDFEDSYILEEQLYKEIAVQAMFKPEKGYSPDVEMAFEYKVSGNDKWNSIKLIRDKNNANLFDGYWDLSGSELEFLPVGKYDVRFAVTDGVKTAYSNIQTVSLEGEKVAPTIQIISPKDESTVGGKSVELSVSVSDNVDVVQVEFSYSTDGITFTQIGDKITPDGDYVHINWDTQSLPSGNYTVKIDATDPRGNVGEETVAFTLDTTAPALPEDFAVTSTSRYIFVDWDKGYDLEEDFENFCIYRSEKQDGDYKVVSKQRLIGYYDDGESISAYETYYYYLTVCDIYGNESEPSEIKSAKMMEDNESPIIGDMLPNNGSELCNTANLLVTASDNYRLEKAVFEYRLVGTDKWNEIAVVNLDKATNNTTFNYKWNIADFETGSYEIRASVYDETVLHSGANGGKYQPNAPATVLRTVSIKKYTLPVAPELTANSSYKHIEFNWTYDGDISLLQNFMIYSSDKQNGSYDLEAVVSRNTLNYGIDVPVGQTKYYKVTANDKYGKNASSNVVSASSVGTDTENPVAVISPDSLVATKSVSFKFSAVNSTDNDVIVSYSWDFGDGETSDDATVEHAYNEEGNYQVTLTVVDECGNVGTVTKEIKVVDISSPDSKYALVTFHVVDAAKADTPAIADATISISSEIPGSVNTTVTTDANGDATVLLMKGKHNVSTTAASFMPSTKTFIANDGVNGVIKATIGLSNTSLVLGELTVKEMTYDEILAAGIDVNHPDNQHVWKFATTLSFTVGLKTYDLPITAGYKNSAGTFKNERGGWYGLGGAGGGGGAGSGGGGGGMKIGIFPLPIEGFYLIIYGEAHWLKEMYNVELLVMNASYVDTIEDCVAELVLPDGLSLAAMLNKQQTNKIEIGTIASGDKKNAQWFVCGDKEGEYYLSAKVDGSLVADSVSEPFSQVFTTDNPVKVYAGSALKLTITADDYAERGEPYNVDFRLTNVSDKSLYNLSFGITGVEQGKILTMVKNDGVETVKLPIESEDFGDSLMQEVGELAPGGYLEVKMSTTCWFNSAAEIAEAALKIASKKNAFTAVFGEFIDVVYYLDQVDVATLEGSTTTIPYEVIIRRVERENLIEKAANVLADELIGELLPEDWKTYLGSPAEIIGGTLDLDSDVIAGSKELLNFSQGQTDYTFELSLNDGRGTANSIENDYVSLTMGDDANGVVDFLTSPGMKIDSGGVSIEYKMPGSTQFKVAVKNKLGELQTEYVVNAKISENELKESLSVSPISGVENNFKLNENELNVALGRKTDKVKTEYMKNPYQIYESELEFSLEGQSSNKNYSVTTTAKDFDSIVNKSYTTKLTYNGETAKISFDRAAMETIAETVTEQTGDVVVTAERISDELANEISDGRPTYKLGVNSNGVAVSEFGEGEVYVAFPYELEGQNVVVIEHIRDDGTREYINGTYNAVTKQVEFKTKSFSYFAICSLDGEILEKTPTVIGSATAPGEILTASVEGVEDSELVYKWYRGDNFTTPIATGKSYELSILDSNAIITVRATGTVDGIYDSALYTETSVRVSKMSITGSIDVTYTTPLKEGSVLQVDTSDISPLLDASELTFEWVGAKGTSNTNTYSITADDVSEEVDIKVTVKPDSKSDYAGSITSSTIEVRKLPVQVTGDLSTPDIYANHTDNASKAALLNAIQSANGTLAASYEGGTTTVDVTWSRMEGTWKESGGTYTFKGVVAPTEADKYVYFGDDLTLDITVKPIKVSIELEPSSISLSKAQATADGASFESIGMPNIAVLTYDVPGIVTPESVVPVFDKDISYVKNAGQTVAEGKDANVKITMTSEGLPAWATLPEIMPSVQVLITNKYPIPSGDISFDDINITYGTDYTPDAVIADKAAYQGAVLSYTYTDKNGIVINKPTEAGVYTVNVVAENDNYKGTAAALLTISAKPISNVAVTLPTDFEPVYNGNEHITTVTVMDNDLMLTNDKDYEVSYSNNINAGTASIIITGKGNYSETYTKTFEIQKASISALKPVIKGEGEVGKVLNASIDGVISSDTQLNWQWYIVGENDYTPITNANLTYHQIENLQSGSKMAVKALAKNEAGSNYEGETLPSEAVSIKKLKVEGTLEFSLTTDLNLNGLVDVDDVITLTPKTTVELTGAPYKFTLNGDDLSDANDYSINYTIKDTDAASSLSFGFKVTDIYDCELSTSIEVGKKPLPAGWNIAYEGEASVGRVLSLVAPDTIESEDYSIQWLVNNEIIANATNSTYTIKTTDQGKTISVRIAALGVYTGSLQVGEISVPAAVPAAPTLSSVAGNNQITLSWNTPFDNGAPIIKYIINITSPISAQKTVEVDSQTNGYIFTGLTNGTQYSFVVNAVNSVGNSVNSNTVTSTPTSGNTGDNGGGGGGGAAGFTVKFETNGAGAIKSQLIDKNGVVTAPTAPVKEGYTFEGWYTDKELTTKYDFATSVTKDFTLYAKWIKAQAVPEEPANTGFSDVDASDWFFEAVQYAVDNKLMYGVSGTEFAPNDTLTRAMLVTVLYRNEGEPAVNRSIPFGDVDAGSYYANAVVWAQQNGIVSGENKNTFAPDNNITREQIATILYRYASYKGMNAVNLSENLGFVDSNKISEYAISAMNWAVGTGLIKGYENKTVRPLDNATRAEAAALLQRFLESNK